MIESRHPDGVWNTTCYAYREWGIIVKSRRGGGMKAHAMRPGTTDVEFTLRYAFIKPDELLKRVERKIDNNIKSDSDGKEN